MNVSFPSPVPQSSRWEGEASLHGEGSSPGYAGAQCGKTEVEPSYWVNQHGSAGAS